MKRSFFQAAVTSKLLYGCTTWTLTKRLEKKLDGNYTRMLRAILNKSWQQHPTRHQLYGHLPPITKTIQVRRTRHAGHCWRSRDELIRDVLLWIPTHGRAKAGRPARTYIQQLCEDTGCCPEDLPRAMNDREEWRERVRDIRATSAIWWWWYISHFILERVDILWCVRDEWRQGQTAILTQLLLLTIGALLPHLGWGYSTEGRWEPQPSVCKLALTLAFLSSTNSTAAGTCLYSFITSSCFRFFFRLFTQVHLWLTARSRVNIQQRLYFSIMI